MNCEPVEYLVDPRFNEHFSRVQQAFIYINDQCNLQCKQCIYKPHVTYNNDREIPLDQAMGLLKVMRSLGAHKVTLLGGEPTLYGRRSTNSLTALIRFCHDIGFSYVRIDTNGLFPPSMCENSLRELDELAFSLDGYDSRTNDALRGLGTYQKIIKQIGHAVQLGLNTSITCCIHRDIVTKGDNGVTGVERVIKLGETLGVSTVNFHDLFKAGVPMDTWTGAFNTTVEEHIEMYEDVYPKIERGEFAVEVRLPQCFVKRSTFDHDPEYFGYCPVKLGERVMIHSDGVIRICSNLICSSFGTANYTSDTITWNSTASNEMLKHDLTLMTPCTNRSQNMKYGDYVPLCFSFKPQQNEPSWKALGWDDRLVTRETTRA